MRTKGGNGNPVDFEQFMKDIKTVVQDGEALLKSGFTQVKQRAISGTKSTDRAVRMHPYQSLGLIFGLGVFVGVLAVSMFMSGVAEEEQE